VLTSGPPEVEPASAVVGDWDCCFLEGVPIESEEAWRRVLDTGRLAEVEGAFALAWVSTDGTAYLARDAVGERTLYYAVSGEGLAFASDLRALLARGYAERSLDARGLLAYLSYGYVPGTATLVSGVHELLPGEIVSAEAGCLAHSSFWALPAEDHLVRAEGEYVRELRGLLERAVGRRLPAAEPVAASLSGGIDSSAVVALARSLSEGRLRTYSLTFGPDYPNELEFSRLVAVRCGAEHRVVEVTPRQVMERFDDVHGALSSPIGEPLTVPNFLLFEEVAAEGVDVLLNGEGGDPCFGGPKNAPMLLAELYGGGRRDSFPYRRERMYLRAHRKCHGHLWELLDESVLATLAENPLEPTLTEALADPRWPSLIGRLMALNVRFKGAHHILDKVDQLSVPSGVVPRSPLFDRAVVDAAVRMPARMRFTGAAEKQALKLAVADIVPSEVVDRPKSGMRVPVSYWLQGPFGRFARERIVDGLRPYGLFDQAYLENLVADKPSVFRANRSAQIWLLLSLEAWLRTVLVGAHASAQRPALTV
jgi:asparagine synthase (glutamine-hydrolysing)